MRIGSALQTILLISLGAAAGANLRYLVSQQLAKLTAAFPYGTLVVNISGSFLLGLFLVWTTERTFADPRWRLLIAVGLCGGYTTYSSFSYESLALFEQGRWLASGVNVVLNNTLCLAAVLGGAALARSL